MLSAWLSRLLVAFCALVATNAAAQSSGGDRPGDAFQIRNERNTETTGHSTSSSHDVDTLMERVIAIRDDGIELEYDLLPSATAEERQISWQFPVRVLRAPGQPLTLLNEAEVNARLQRWIDAAQVRAFCGQWIFTWNAFKIECDPQAALRGLERFDLRSVELRDGALFQDTGAIAPVSLRLEHPGVFVAEMQVDPETVRRARAEADVAVAQIMRGAPLTEDAALAAHASDRISGTIVTRFETDASGRIVRRIRITQTDIERANGETEHQTVHETTERSALRHP